MISSWQAVAYLGAHLVTINKYSRPLFISVLTTFASNGSLVVVREGLHTHRDTSPSTWRFDMLVSIGKTMYCNSLQTAVSYSTRVTFWLTANVVSRICRRPASILSLPQHGLPTESRTPIKGLEVPCTIHYTIGRYRRLLDTSYHAELVSHSVIWCDLPNHLLAVFVRWATQETTRYPILMPNQYQSLS